MTPAIVYLHGFASSPASVKARALAAHVAALPQASRPRLWIPDLAFTPRAAVGHVLAWVRAEVSAPANELTLVGSSLGGFYATHLAEALAARAVLINPAIRPYDDLARFAGTQTNLYSGARFEVTAAHFDELRTLAVAHITRPDRYWLMVQTGDEVLDWREAVAFYAGARQLVEGGGDHGFANFAAQIAPLLRFAGVRESA